MKRQTIIGLITLSFIFAVGVYNAKQDAPNDIVSIKFHLEANGMNCVLLSSSLIVSRTSISPSEAIEFENFIDPKAPLVRLSAITGDESLEESPNLRVVCNGKYWLAGEPALIDKIFRLIGR